MKAYYPDGQIIVYPIEIKDIEWHDDKGFIGDKEIFYIYEYNGEYRMVSHLPWIGGKRSRSKKFLKTLASHILKDFVCQFITRDTKNYVKLAKEE